VRLYEVLRIIIKEGNSLKTAEDNFRKRAEELVASMTENEKLGMLSTHHSEIPRLGLGEFFVGTEVARGYVGRQPDMISTVFPQPEGLAATFDRELMQQLGTVAGKEGRAYFNRNKKGGLCLWGPTVDLVRDPRWGRTEEAYGEDPFLAGQLAAAYTDGMAGRTEDGYYLTVPTLKHFCADNNEEARDRCNAVLPLRLKYEYYYASFEDPVVNGGARSLMAAYNEINGIPAIMNPELETKLKEEWGLWFVVSDGGDMSQTVTSHRVTRKMSEAYAWALKGGCDVMTEGDMTVRPAAEQALKEGSVTWEDIDRSLVRVVEARIRLGHLDKTPFDDIDDSVIDCPEHQKINLRASREQVTMLANRGLLPIEETPENIAVVGPLADENLMDWYTGYSAREVSVLDGIKREYSGAVVEHDSLWDRVSVLCPNGKYLSAKSDGTVIADADRVTDAEIFELQDWGENWQNLYSVLYKRYVRLFDEDNEIRLHNRKVYDWFTRETFNFFEYNGKTVIEEFLGHRRLVCDEDGKLSVKAERAVSDDMLFKIITESSGEQRAADIADRNDLVIYCVGNHPTQVAKECYDRKTLDLNIQRGMTFKMAMHNPNTLLVIISSYPYAFNAGEEYAGAILWTSHAGEHLGTVVAETVRGKNNPSGKLPLTWYKSELDLPDIMNYDIENAGSTYMYFKGEPLFPFGHGLSYSTFDYSDLSFVQTADGVDLTLTVSNTSEYDGTETVQIYFTADGSEVSRPLRKLCAFERVALKAGESKSVTLKAPSFIFRIFDLRSGRMLVEDCDCTFAAGSSSSDIRLETKLHISGEKIGERPASFSVLTYEKAQDVTIGWSHAVGESYVTARGWHGSLVYGGIDFKKYKTVTVTLGSIMGAKELKCVCGGEEVTIPLTTTDSFDTPESFTADIPADTKSDELVIVPAGGCAVYRIEFN